MRNYAIFCRTANDDVDALKMQCIRCFEAFINDMQENNIDGNLYVIMENNQPSTKDFSPKFKKLLNLIVHNEIEKVYTLNVPRLTRNPQRLMEIKFVLEQMKSDIYIVDIGELLYKDHLSKFKSGIKLVEPSHDEMEKE